MELRIAHLSDIHFKNEENLIGINSDDNMREDVVRELKKLSDEHGALDAVIISGDIAYSGKADEFAVARRWLYSLLERTNSPNAKIIVCPGNHDIDRAVLDETILDMHDKVRGERNVEKRQDLLLSRLNNSRSRDLLMTSLENYNQFALEFGCEFYPDKERYSWSKDLSLNDGSILRVRGFNSTILCGKKDIKQSLFLGRNSWGLRKEDGVEYLVFSHHPPSWLFDEVEMKNELDDKARVQMYGHEHASRIDPGIDSVRIFAGAVNPERDHSGWVPGFNLLRLSVQNTNKTRTLNVIIHSMQWQNTAPSQFVLYRGKHSDGTHRYSFALTPWTPATAPAIKNSAVDEVRESKSCKVTPTAVAVAAGAPLHITEHDFIRKFFDLNYADQIKVLTELGLTDEKESTLPQFVKIKNGLRRAKEKGMLFEIMKKIDKRNY